MSHFPSRFSSVAGCALGAWLLLSGAQISRAQDAIPAPAPFKVPALIGIPGGVKAPAPLGAPGAPGAVTSDADLTAPNKVSVEASVTLAQLQSGALTPDAAWASGQLTADDIVRALNAPRLFESEKPDDVRFRGALVELLLEHGKEKWLPVEGKIATPVGAKLSNRALLGVADALSVRRDERAVSIYEAMLVEAERERGNYRAVGALNHLASFYWDQDKLQQAADVFARGERYSSSPEWAAALRLDGARVYKQMGNEAKAAELYEQIPQFGSGWVSGIAIHDQASILIHQGQNEAARRLLMMPIVGKDTNLIQIAIESLLALSYYKTGNLELAKQHCQATFQKASAITIPQDKGLEATINVAQEIQSWSEQWRKTPILLTNDNLRIALAPQGSDEKPVTRRLFVRTLRDVPLIATVDDKRIGIRVTNNKQENDYFVQTELALEVPQPLMQSANAILTVSSPQIPAYQAKMQLQVEVPLPIHLSSSNVFFGEVKAKEATTQTLTLSAATPFRVMDVRTDTPMLEIQSPAPPTQAAKEQTLILSFTSPQVGRFYSGTIRIQTDMPRQEVIEMPYGAHIK